MPDLSPKATALINKYDAGDLAEQVVELEAELEKQKHESNRLYGVGQDIEELRVQLETENAAQAQTIKAAHIRTAEISTRYNDLKYELKERTDQYHLAHAKILSREAINEGLGKDYNALKNDLLNVLKIAIARGESLGYEDEDWREWLKSLEGGDDE